MRACEVNDKKSKCYEIIMLMKKVNYLRIKMYTFNEKIYTK